MEKPAVLALTSTFPRWQNDTTPSFVASLSEKLSKKNRMIVLAPHYPLAKKEEIFGGVRVRRFQYFFPQSTQKLCYGGGMLPNVKKNPFLLFQLPLLLKMEYFFGVDIVKKEKISLLHAHWMIPQGIVGIFLKKRFGIPLIVTIHGSDLFPLKNLFFRKIQTWVCEGADRITVNSRATYDELVGRFPSIKKKVSLIPMGVDTSHFRPRTLRREKNLEGKKIILFVGRLSDQKGVDYLIGALSMVKKRYGNAMLLIIGEGPKKEELERKAYDLGVSENIRFLGALPKEEIAYYYCVCDVFVLPSLSNSTGTEALGLSLMEAMASGCAVVGTEVGGIPSLISNGKNGILVPQKESKELSSAIIALLANGKKSKRMGKAASETIRKNYSWEKVGRKFSALYSEVIR